MEAKQQNDQSEAKAVYSETKQRYKIKTTETEEANKMGQQRLRNALTDIFEWVKARVACLLDLHCRRCYAC